MTAFLNEALRFEGEAPSTLRPIRGTRRRAGG
jgi:hypothetical protein